MPERKTPAWRQQKRPLTFPVNGLSGFRLYSLFSQAASRRKAVGVERVCARRGTSPDRSVSDGNSRTCRSSPAVGLAERTHVAMPRAEVRHLRLVKDINTAQGFSTLQRDAYWSFDSDSLAFSFCFVSSGAGICTGSGNNTGSDSLLSSGSSTKSMTSSDCSVFTSVKPSSAS